MILKPTYDTQQCKPINGKIAALYTCSNIVSEDYIIWNNVLVDTQLIHEYVIEHCQEFNNTTISYNL